MERNDTDQGWTIVIRPFSGWFDIHPAELWRYRDLIILFVKRDFISVYKQTILGPLWFLMQPLLTALVFTVIFGQIAGLPTDGAPQILFYMSGIVAWTYFANCLTKTSNTFAGNVHIFGRVYFPRLTVPVSVVVSNLVTLGIQFILFLGFFLYYLSAGAAISPKPLAMLLLPFLVMQMAILGLGFGIIVSSLTTKYRDLTYLISFGVQLWMFATPVVYPSSRIPEKWQWLILINPMSPVIETFRYAFLGSGTVYPQSFVLSSIITVMVFMTGILLFSRMEKNFLDTV